MTDQDVLDQIEREFGACPRPEHFTDYQHCCECAEHDEVLRSRDRDTLGMGEVGSPGWDPICFVTPEGFAYYLPALARLALARPNPTWVSYVPQLAFQLRYDGAQNARWRQCTPGQRAAVARLLEHIIETRAADVDENCCTDLVFEALAVWSDAARPN